MFESLIGKDASGGYRSAYILAFSFITMVLVLITFILSVILVDNKEEDKAGMTVDPYGQSIRFHQTRDDTGFSGSSMAQKSAGGAEGFGHRELPMSAYWPMKEGILTDSWRGEGTNRASYGGTDFSVAGSGANYAVNNSPQVGYYNNPTNSTESMSSRNFTEGDLQQLVHGA